MSDPNRSTPPCPCPRPRPLPAFPGMRAWALACVSVVLFSSPFCRPIDAAQARRRVTFRRDGVAYDREITTFTEDGRLAQVEYGLEASLRGSTVGAMRVGIPAAATVTTDQTGDGNGDDGDDDDNGEPDGSALSPPKKTQQSAPSSSCIVVCIEHSSFGKMHRIDDHIWMLTAGLSGDARMLAGMARRSCQNHRLRYGEAPTVGQAARITAEFHHRLTRTGGCRPMGCTAILLGVDRHGGSGGSHTARLFRTDPGGGFEECRCCAAGKSRDAVAKELAALVDAPGYGQDNDNDNGGSSPKRQSGGDREALSSESRGGAIARTAAAMAGRVLRLLDPGSHSKRGGKPQPASAAATVDVWTIEPRDGCRGGMLATCYSDVRKDNAERIVSVQDALA